MALMKQSTNDDVLQELKQENKRLNDKLDKLLEGKNV